MVRLPWQSSHGLMCRLRMGAQRVLVVIVLLAVGCFTPTRAGAQTVYGSVVGVVTDDTGAVVPSATVTITRTETNEIRQTTSNGAGDYSLLTVPAGTYKVVVAKAGFKLFETTNIAVNPNAAVRVDAALVLGEQTQSINVTAEDAVLARRYGIRNRAALISAYRSPR